MSKGRRDSISNKVGKYFSYLTSTVPLPNFAGDKKMAQSNPVRYQPQKPNPGEELRDGQSRPRRAALSRKNSASKSSHDMYATKNFDKIDYIVQIPMIDNPNERQSRFLLAMDYRLPPRDGLGLMDTSLEHMVHYFDMKKAELIFCEQWQSVCLFIEFPDTEMARDSYDTLFQFFKTIFYVTDLCELEELWICSHCRHYNQFDEYLRGHNNMNHKRKAANGDDYIYWCSRCRHVNDSSYKKIKYLYQKRGHRKGASAKSNRNQIGSVSRYVDYKTPEHDDDLENANAQHNNHNNHNNGNLASTSSIASHMLQQSKSHGPPSSTRPGPDVLMGQAHGPLRFNNARNKRKHKPNPLLPSKSTGHLHHNNGNESRTHAHHERFGSATSASSRASSSFEVLSPASSVSVHQLPTTSIPSKNSSVDSSQSLGSNASYQTVSSIGNGLDLCCNILESMQHEAQQHAASHETGTPPGGMVGVQEFDTQTHYTMSKIAALKNMLHYIEQKVQRSVSEFHGSRLSSPELQHTDVASRAVNEPVTNGNYDYGSAVGPPQLLSDEDTNYTLSVPHDDDDGNSVSTDAVGGVGYEQENRRIVTAGTSMLGDARGPVVFKLPSAHSAQQREYRYQDRRK